MLRNKSTIELAALLWPLFRNDNILLYSNSLKCSSNAFRIIGFKAWQLWQSCGAQSLFLPNSPN